jgi:IS30 family transposase
MSRKCFSLNIHGRYNPHIAQRKAIQRQEEKTKRRRREILVELKKFVISKMKEEWSPEQIFGEL